MTLKSLRKTRPFQNGGKAVAMEGKFTQSHTDLEKETASTLNIQITVNVIWVNNGVSRRISDSFTYTLTCNLCLDNTNINLQTCITLIELLNNQIVAVFQAINNAVLFVFDVTVRHISFDLSPHAQPLTFTSLVCLIVCYKNTSFPLPCKSVSNASTSSL